MSEQEVQAEAPVDSEVQARVVHEPDIERQRNQWWMSTLKETPNPGTYETPDFIDEMNKNPVSNTYSFKTIGRRNSSYPYGRGNLLLPGLYEVPDSYDNLRKKPASYNFKAPQRQTLATEVRAPPPNQYNAEKYGTIDGSKCNVKSSSFKTEVQRIPVFKPVSVSRKRQKPAAILQKATTDQNLDRQLTTRESESESETRPEKATSLIRDGPGPGQYEPKLLKHELAISSSFRSKEQRFKTAASRVPGPGSYDKCCYDRSRLHITKTLNDMGRKNGLFFSYSPMI